jgi:uncharacterized membrane protein
LELAGVVIIIGGAIIASFRFARSGLMTGGWRSAYVQYRSNLGRGILLELELLVGADIISTITAPLTAESVGLLGGIVVICCTLIRSLSISVSEGIASTNAASSSARVKGAVE